MFSTSFSGVLFGLLIILQTLIAVSALPTSTTAMSFCAQLGIRQASDFNRCNNNNHGNDDNNVTPPNNTTSSERLAIRGMSSQLDKRDNSENKELDSNGMSSGEKLATVIASLTLLVAMIPLLRCSRFRHWASSSIPPFIKKALGIAPLNPGSTTATATQSLSAIPASEIPMPRPVFIYNAYSRAHLTGTFFNPFIYSQNGIAREDGRVLKEEESPVPRRPMRVVTYPSQ